MDLLSTVRKEGSRGGRADFKWEDVKNDAQRENYLGHSLMAPVGRWQKGKDLNWYAKGDQGKDAMTEAEKRKEEIRKVKEAEEDARLVALGLPPKNANANLIPLGESKMEISEVPAKDEEVKKEEIERRKDGKHRHKHHHGHKHRKYRSESRDCGRHSRRRSRSRSRERDVDKRRYRSRSRSQERDGDRRRARSRSPVRRMDETAHRRSYEDRARPRSAYKEERRTRRYSREFSQSPERRRRRRSKDRSPYRER